VINEISDKTIAKFGISLGDLVGDDLSLQPKYKSVISTMGLPWYNVMGNHDMNYDAKEDSLSDESFEQTFGPITLRSIMETRILSFLIISFIRIHGQVKVI
jgi:hypothetical protein